MTYTVKSGEMWDAIAKKLYGDERLMTALIEQNPDYAGTFIFGGGEVLTYDDLTPEQASSAPPWRKSE